MAMYAEANQTTTYPDYRYQKPENGSGSAKASAPTGADNHDDGEKAKAVERLNLAFQK